MYPFSLLHAYMHIISLRKLLLCVRVYLDHRFKSWLWWLSNTYWKVKAQSILISYEVSEEGILGWLKVYAAAAICKVYSSRESGLALLIQEKGCLLVNIWIFLSLTSVKWMMLLKMFWHWFTNELNLQYGI